MPVLKEDRGTGRAGVLAAVVAGSIAAALLGATTLPGWADKLPESAAATMIGDAARSFDRAMAALGLTWPYDRLRAGVRWMEARKFPAPSDEESEPTDKD